MVLSLYLNDRCLLQPNEYLMTEILHSYHGGSHESAEDEYRDGAIPYLQELNDEYKRLLREMNTHSKTYDCDMYIDERDDYHEMNKKCLTNDICIAIIQEAESWLTKASNCLGVYHYQPFQIRVRLRRYYRSMIQNWNNYSCFSTLTVPRTSVGDVEKISKSTCINGLQHCYQYMIITIHEVLRTLPNIASYYNEYEQLLIQHFPKDMIYAGKSQTWCTRQVNKWMSL